MDRKMKFLASLLVVMLAALGVSPVQGAPIGTAQAVYGPSGDISIDVNAVAQFKVYIGDAVQAEIADPAIDALSLDGAEPVWMSGSTWHEDKVEGYDTELWAETAFEDTISTPGLTWMDTGVNVDTSQLGPDVRLLLRYQTLENPPVIVSVIPEPGTLILLGIGGLWIVLGLFRCRNRR